MKVKNLFLTLVAFSALAIGGCSQSGDPTSDPTSNPTSEPSSEPSSEPVHEHSWESTWTEDDDYHWHRCTGCDAIKDKDVHHFSEKESVPATCDTVEQIIYECAECGHLKIDYTGHSLKAHEYKVKITKPATCSHEGDITISCVHCGKSTVEHYSDAKAHVFGDPVVTDGITSYKCKECNFERRVIDASDKTTHEVPAEDLKATGEIELQTAAIAFPESVLDQLGSNISISAEPKTVDDLDKVSEDDKELIRGGRIVDFSLKSDLEEVSQFDGKLEISIPYPLGEGEDPSGIVVWYLDEDGNPTPIEAEYRNGFAVFATNHFSFYAVLNLSPEQLCEHFGHVDMTALTVPSTCVAHGYKDVTCRRCARAIRTELPLENHSFKFVEKKDSTTTEEGYIKYRCENCGEEQITVTPKKSADEKGFYTNFLLSLGTSDLHMTGVATMTDPMTGNTQESPVEMYFGYDSEHLPFVYGDASGSLIGFYRGYSISSDYSLSEAPQNLLVALSQFAELFDMLPGFVPEYVEKVGDFVVGKFFNKVEIPEGYEITINKQAVLNVVTEFATKPLGEALASFFGPEFLVKVTSFINKVYDSTINDVINDLQSHGIVLNEVFNAVKAILKIVAPQIAEQLDNIDLDAYLTDEVKAMKVIDYLKQMIPNAESILPPDAATAAQLIGRFLSMNLFEIISGMFPVNGGGSSGGAPTSMPSQPRASVSTGSLAEEIIRMTELVLQSVNLKLKTESNGAFLQSEITLSNFGQVIGQISLGDVKTLVVKGFDKAPIIEKLEQMFARAQERKRVFKIGPDNLKFVEDFYAQQFPGIKFNYVEEYVYQRYGELVTSPAIVSKENVNYTIFNPEKWQLEEQTGKLVITLRENPYIRVVTNFNGLGTRLAKDGIGLVLTSHNLVNEAYFTFEVESEEGKLPYTYHVGDYTYRGEKGLLRGEFLYSFDDQKMYNTTGTYDYFMHATEAERSVKIITEEEYKAMGGRVPVVQEGYKVVYMLKTSSSYSYTDYISVPDSNYYLDENRNVLTNYFVSIDMNDEALEYANAFNLETYYVNGNFEVRPAILSNLRIGNLDFNFEYDEEAKAIIIGNAKIAFDVIDGSKECNKVVKWQYLVNDKVVKSGSYNSHVLSEYDVEYVEKRISECETRVTELHVCKHCGKKYYYSSWIRTYHHYEETDHQEATLAQPGYTVYTCTVCGDSYGDVEYQCTHFDYHYEEDEHGNSIFVCNRCGYTVQSETRPLMAIEKVDETEEVLQYAYYFFLEDYAYQEKTSDNYNFYLTVQHYNEETEEWEFAEEVQPYQLRKYTEYEEFTIKEVDRWVRYPHYYFDVPVETLTSLQEQYSGEDYRVVFAAVPFGEMGSAFILSL